MEGLSLSSIISYIDEYSMQISMLLICLLSAVLAVFIWLWFYNKKKYHNLKHQIPANVVKNYLDSIIQNSTALKSSLFRGGGLDTDTSSLPSVMPLADLQGGGQVAVDSSDSSALKAQISSLESMLQDKTSIITQLESSNASLSGDVKAKDTTIDELEVIIESLKNNPSSSEAVEDNSHLIETLEAQVLSLKEQLEEYEIISADIANMKKLREENAQLKESLKNQDSNLAADISEDSPEDLTEDLDVAEAIEEVEIEEPVIEETIADDDSKEEIKIEGALAEDDFIQSQLDKKADNDSGEESESVAEAKIEPQPEQQEEVEVKAISEEDDADESKSPEDLLSEFEKMLG